MILVNINRNFYNEAHYNVKDKNLLRDVKFLSDITNLKLNEDIKVGGRVVSKRDFKNVIFFHLKDFQVEKQFMYLKDNKDINVKFKLGDFLIVQGCNVVNKVSKKKIIQAKKIFIVGSTLTYFPKIFYGINKDNRSTYKTLVNIFSEKKFNSIRKRFEALQYIRKIMQELNFFEVDTPILNDFSTADVAEDFITKNNHNITKFLRAAPEINLKKLLVMGYRNIFELGKCFRNEGLSKLHLNEFTMMEMYSAFSNFEFMCQIVRIVILKLYQYFVQISIDFKNVEYSVIQNQFEQENSILDVEQYKNYAYKNNIDINNLSDEKIKNKLIEEYFMSFNEDWTFLNHFPSAVSCLAKPLYNNKKIANRSVLFFKNIEVAEIYDELNDPIIQEKFLKNNLEEFQTDLFIGMPCSSGAGIGIERLLTIIFNLTQVKDLIV